MKTESDKHGIFHSFIEEYSFTHRVKIFYIDGHAGVTLRTRCRNEGTE